MQQDNQTKPTQNTAISAEQVSSYLRSFPHFFEQHASLLAEIYLPSPHGKGAVSLAERQQIAQRDKIKGLETKLSSLISYANENDTTSAKVHDFSVNLLKCANFEDLQKRIEQSMQDDFAVTQSAIRIWASPAESQQATDFSAENKDFIAWAGALAQPHCGAKPTVADGLLGEQLQSFAFIPLQTDTAEKAVFGVLILGAEDTQRFKADMGLMYLERIGALVSAALLSYF